MNNWIPEVSKFLTHLCIEHETLPNCIKINRDSAVSNIDGIYENDSYDILRSRINDVFGNDNTNRFYYALKNDDWLLLEKIP